MRSPTPKDLTQIQSLSLKLTTINKFIPKLAEHMCPIREVRKALDATNGPDWTNEADKAFQKIKIKLNKLQILTISKEGGLLLLCLCQGNKMISSMLFVKRNGIQSPVSYEKEVKGPVMKGFCKQEEQVLMVPDANDAETSELGSYVIHLNFNAPNHIMNYEALLAGLVALAVKGMKDLHVFINLQILVDHVEGNRIPAMEQENRYREEIMDATTPFHRFRITHLPKILNPKAKMLTRLATIQLEFLNQEVSVGIKTRPMESYEKERRAIGKMPMGKPNYNWETSGSN
ncbi:reverse transcriptase domain-containing protein [Tanacetum coccineum]